MLFMRSRADCTSVGEAVGNEMRREMTEMREEMRALRELVQRALDAKA